MRVPRPYLDEHMGGDPATRAEDRRFFPDPRVMAREFFPSLGRSFDSFANLISPQFIFDRDGWTQEQRAVGAFASDTARFFLGTEYTELERLAQNERDLQREYPHLSTAAQGFVETTPLGSRGWTGFVEHLEQEPAELPLELALMGAGKAITGARRLMRAATPFDADVFNRTDLMTGQRLPSAAEASVAIQTYRGARLLEEASGIRVGPQTIATASHVVAGQPGRPFSPTVMTARGLEGGQTGMIRGVQGILPEADIALLEAADISDDYLPLSDLVPGLPHEAVGDLGAGLETFSGVVGPRRYTDLATDAAIAETTLPGRGGLSGAGLIAESGDVSGVYLGALGQRGLFATGGTVLDFQQQIQGRAPIPVSQLHTGTIVDAIQQQGLHYRLARRDPTVSASPFLLGGLALHGRYGVQDPFSLVRLDPTRHREFDEGPVSGVYAYEGDIRDMLFEIKNPSIGSQRRESLLEYLRSETELWHVPDIFQGGRYDAITAVPSSVDRLRQRGFNQAEFYAEIFSDVMGIPFERDLVRRVRETTESSGLEGVVARQTNLSGAFTADPSVAGKNILTIDDIVATGTTMRETLSALRQAGATQTGGLGIASSLHNFMHPRAGLSRFSAQDVGTRTWGGTDFTSSQQQAISHLEGPGVISAVPGAGKTDVLVERVQELMGSGVSPSEVLTVAYNRAAIGELTSRFEAAGLTSAQARTVHSLAHEIVMDPQNFTGVGFSHRPKIARDLTQERFRQMARQYPDAQVDFDQSESFRMAAAAETDEDWLVAYQEFKRERGLMTFGQMLDVGAEILETRPDVRQRYLEKYPFLQIDEFQDIADREWNFLSKLTPNVLGVGDINQAIYGFRGATGNVMADLYGQSRQYHLPETFRSTPEIFQTAQRLIGLNEERIPIEGRSLLGSGAPVDFRPTTQDTVFSELESILASRQTDESTAVLVRTNREIKRLLDTLGEEAFENVDIGTIHKGKGQGWDRVILPMETVPVRFGDSPEMIWTPRMRNQVDIENARRVGYVGLTRARQHAHVLGGGDLFEEMRTGERHLQLHGSSSLREFSYGFGDVMDENAASLSDLDRIIRDTGRFFRATDPREDSFKNISLDWQQTLNLSHRLQELEPYDLPLRGEESALFPREFYEQYKRELDYMLHRESYVDESPYEPGMMGVYRPGIYVGTDLEMMFKQGFWNPEPRYHMGGRELRIFEGEKIMEGFVSGEPSFYAPAGETIIKPSRQIGTFDYDDLYDLRTDEPFTGMPMELQYELHNYSIRDLRPLEQLEQQLRLHGRSGGGRNLIEGAPQVPVASFSPILGGDDDGNGIDINTATAEDLQQLSGVGAGLAERILSYRTVMGGFSSFDELGNVRGMSPRRLAAIQSHVSVGAPYLPRLHPYGRSTGAFPAVPSLLGSPFEIDRGLDINTATAVELEALPGIGQVTAERIIADREAQGQFPSLQSLTRVKGIGSRLLSRMEPTLLQFGPEPHPEVTPHGLDPYELPLLGDPRIGHATAFDIPIPGYELPYEYPSDMRDHIPLGGSPDAPLYDSLSITEVPLESGFAYSLRKFQEAQGGATVFRDPSSNDEGYSRRRRGRRGYDLEAGLQAELQYLPRRALRHYTRHGTDGLGEMLMSYPGEALQRQGVRVAKNYAWDAVRSGFTGQQMPGLEHYLGDTLSTGITEAFSNPLGAVAGGVGLAALTAYIGESSLDANYADVIEHEGAREQRFYDRFRENSPTRAVEIGGKALQPGGLEKLIESIVLRLFAEGTGEISDKLVTRIGRKLNIQMGRGQV